MLEATNMFFSRTADQLELPSSLRTILQTPDARYGWKSLHKAMTVKYSISLAFACSTTVLGGR
jgi:hypothetical protein